MNGLVLPQGSRRAQRGARSLALLALLVLSACSSSPHAGVDDSAGMRAGEGRAGEQGRNDAGGTRDAAAAKTDVDATREGPRRGAADVLPDVLDAARPAAPRADDAAVRSSADGSQADPSAPTDAASPAFVLTPVDFPSVGDELTFPESANPPANVSPAFEWAGVPTGTKSLALVFRDLGNGAVKWILWDIPATQTRVPSGISKTAMPAEVPGSSQLGSLNNQGYAGPGSGARQYDFKLWALDVERLPGSASLTTLQIHDQVLPMHAIATTAPVLLRNTHNAP